MILLSESRTPSSPPTANLAAPAGNNSAPKFWAEKWAATWGIYSQPRPKPRAITLTRPLGVLAPKTLVAKTYPNLTVMIDYLYSQKHPNYSQKHQMTVVMSNHYSQIEKKRVHDCSVTVVQLGHTTVTLQSNT